MVQFIVVHTVSQILSFYKLCFFPSGGNFFANFLHDRRKLLRNILFVGFVAMPMGGLAGAILGLGFGFLFAIGGAGGRVIFAFPLNGLCYGQAIAVILSVLLTVILGESFVVPLRRKALLFARFVFTNGDSASPSEPKGMKKPPLP